MPVPYFLQRLGTGFQQVLATAVGGAGNADKLVATGPGGVIGMSLFPAGIGQNMAVVPASEALAAGDQVNLWLNAGVLSARKADATAASAGKRADGFVQSAVASGASATVYRNGGQNTGLTGLVIGTDYYLGAAGAVTPTQNTTSGQTDQYIGKASAANVLDQLPPQPPVVNA